MKTMSKVVLLASMLWLGGCASVPEAERESPPPMSITANVQAYLGKTVHWGGRIVSLKNLEKSTEIQLVAYPLKSNGVPDVKADPAGRFIAEAPGYLESMEYAPGRLLRVSGTVSGVRVGKVGSAEYRFPLVVVEDLKLLPKMAAGVKPRVNFGFSIGSGGRSGVGIGIGF